MTSSVHTFGVVVVLAVALLLTRPVMGASAGESSYRGWNTIELDNGLIEVQVAPDIGGRIIQITLGKSEYFWVNDQLAGTLPPPTGVGPNGEWLNYGGDKLWPAPQGWDRDDQWHGPPDPVLDGSPHAGAVLVGEGSPVSVQLTSQKDKRSGVQFSRVIKMFDGSSRVGIDSTMRNIDTKPRRWGIWEVTQHNAANPQGAGHNEKMWAYCPINPKSIYARGYNVMFGLVNNPEFKPDYDSGILRVHYERMVGKIGMDSSAGWLAVVNGTVGNVFVERFSYYPDTEYPDGASVEIWTHGPGRWVQSGEVYEMNDDPIECPYFMESEVLSPFADLQPGETYSFHLDLYAATIGGNYPVLDCTNVGVTCEQFAAKVLGDKLNLTGRFGVFCTGKAGVVLLDAAGSEVANAELDTVLTPAQPCVVSSDVEVNVPAEAATVCLVVIDATGKQLGELARAQIKR